MNLMCLRRGLEPNRAEAESPSRHSAVKGEIAVDLFEQTAMSPEGREKIYHRNAERLFKL